MTEKLEETADKTDAEETTPRPSLAKRVWSITVATTRWLWRRASVALTLAAIIGSFVLGMRAGGGGGDGHEGHAHAQEEKSEVYYCSMHPQIRQDEPGICPICNMELVIMKESGEATGERELVLSEGARKLAEIETVAAVRKSVDVEVRMVGKVDYDETRVKTIAAWLDGRIEKLHADFTGLEVEAGAPLVDLYSPKLYVAQKELMLAAAGVARLPLPEEGAAPLPNLHQALLDASREKLRLWGLTPEQIAAIEGAGEARDTLTIYAPIGGTVVKKQVTEGMYVKEGRPLLTVADLTVVWVQLDAYESDLVWLRIGQTVSLSTEAYPGVPLEGTIKFIDPFVSPKTRTAKVRVEVPNVSGLLKPEMFVRARVAVPIEETDGLYLPTTPFGFTCPMHPEVGRDAAGSCPICGMDLVEKPAAGEASHWTCMMHPEIHENQAGKCPKCGMDLVEQQGGGEAAVPEQLLPLVVPRTAVMLTGKRAVIYVAVPDSDSPRYEGRTIEVGPRAGEFYVIKSGIKEGEEVVVAGNFKIDAALQILAKPSMMSMPSENLEETVSPKFRGSLGGVYRAYFVVWEGLKDDQAEIAAAGYQTLHDSLSGVEKGALSPARLKEWQALDKQLMNRSMAAMKESDIKELRKHFEAVSEAIIALERAFGHSGKNSHYVMFCPMALENRGASWLQESEGLLNPYFGDSMLRCGETKETFAPEGSAPPALEPAGGGGHENHGSH
jgi:membrane fusion protein, copper/silver efflux system